nr:hypothetical protein GCM10010200_024540 [Actinomadura rugatobispora]
MRKILKTREAETTAILAKIEKAEAAGFRIITGGQTGQDT